MCTLAVSVFNSRFGLAGLLFILGFAIGRAPAEEPGSEAGGIHQTHAAPGMTAKYKGSVPDARR